MTKILSLTGKLTAILSFVFGVLIFALFYFTDSDNLLFIGNSYIAFAAFANLIVFSLIIWRYRKTSEESKQKLRKVIILMFLNLPAAILFIYCTVTLTNTMRLRFINRTGNNLTELRVIGCEEKLLEDMQPKDRTGVWVKIINECTVEIEYKENGETKRETVASFVKRGEGRKLKHKIGALE